MGGPGSGSKKGKKASNYKDGRWKNMQEMREKAKREGKGDMVVGHKKAAKRDTKNRNIQGGDTSKGNLRLITKSQNQKEIGRKGKKAKKK